MFIKRKLWRFLKFTLIVNRQFLILKVAIFKKHMLYNILVKYKQVIM